MLLLKLESWEQSVWGEKVTVLFAPVSWERGRPTGLGGGWMVGGICRSSVSLEKRPMEVGVAWCCP